MEGVGPLPQARSPEAAEIAGFFLAPTWQVGFRSESYLTTSTGIERDSAARGWGGTVIACQYRRGLYSGEGEMIHGLYSAASGMVAHQTRLDMLANNLANVDTAGFKADLVSFDVSVTPPDSMSDSALPMSSVLVDRPGVDPRPGPLKTTGNPLDLAIVGPGLFVVETPQGERYTRAGNFVQNTEGFLTTNTGFRVLGSGGPIAVPVTGLQMDETGRLATGESLRFVAGPEQARLVKVGDNLFAPVSETARPADLPAATVVQGQIEGANVNVVMTMVDMLATMRSYEAYQKTIQALDQTVGEAANDLGQV
jgi:flagellar basal-body rod protein FlgF